MINLKHSSESMNYLCFQKSETKLIFMNHEYEFSSIKFCLSKHSIESTANKVMEIKFLKCFNSNISIRKPKANVRAKLRAKL